MTKYWEVILEEDENGDVLLPFPDELIQNQGWLEGDAITWEVKEGYAILINTSAKMREQESGSNK